MNDRERITRLEIRCEQLQLTVNEAFHWIDILKSDLSDLQDKVGYADRRTENSSEKPNNCETCKWGEWYRKGYDITMMSDECGGCCSWNNKWKPKDEPQTEREGE